MVSKEISIMISQVLFHFFGWKLFLFNTIKYEFVLRTSIPYESNYQDFNSRYKFSVKENFFSQRNCQQNESITKKSYTTKNGDSNGLVSVRWLWVWFLKWLYIFFHLSQCIKNDQNALQFFRNYLLVFFQKLIILSFRNVPETQGTRRIVTGILSYKRSRKCKSSRSIQSRINMS